MEVLVLIAMAMVIAHLLWRVRRLEETVALLEAPASPSVEPPVTVAEPAWEAPAEAVSEEPAFHPGPVLVEEEDLSGESPTDAEPEPREGFGFEDIFGRRLPIWAGGITLAVAGMLIVKYSIDAGLVSPLVRVISGLLFGAGLIAAAELALRADARVRDPRVRQALAGAGVASLYGAVLIASNLYGLIGPVAAFLGMAAVTALAMGLSLRFGAPSALLGLAGGLAAPALVGSVAPNIPLLSTYLALAVGGLCVLSRRQKWMWLGVGALSGGFVWSAFLLLGGLLDAAASVSIALYILLLGIGLPMLAASGRLGDVVRVVGSLAAAAQMAALVATGGFTLLHWSLYGLISAAILWVSRRDPKLARLPAAGLAIALLLLCLWPDPTPVGMALVIGIGGALHGLPALLNLWRRSPAMVEAASLAAIALAAFLIPLAHFHRDGTDAGFALLALAAALLPATGAVLGWRVPDRRDDARFTLLVTAAALLAGCAAALVLPAWTLAPAIAAIGAALLALSLRAGDPRLERSAWAFAAAGAVMLALGPQSDAEFARLAGETEAVSRLPALVRWTLLAGLFAGFAWRARSLPGRAVAGALAALFGYGVAAQLLPGDFLPIAAAALLLALAAWNRRLPPGPILPAMGALLLVVLAWATAPLLHWSAGAAESLLGTPLLVTALPAPRDAVLRLLLPALLGAVALWQAGTSLDRRPFAGILAALAVLGGVGIHILFRQVGAIDSAPEFVRYGLAERTGWEALLLLAAFLSWQLGRRWLALGLSAAGLAHFAWYSLLLHNPLWSEQAVGGLPLLSLLLPAYGLPLAWLWLIGRREPGLPMAVERVRAGAPMLLLAFLALSVLRQLFHGSLIAGPEVTAGEDIFRSVVAVLLAIGYLLWGIAKGSRDWRIGSLLLMIAAVAKVFLLDAAGLDGLLRIASFVALGLSLIGIGWLYSRFLGPAVNDAAMKAR